MNPIGLNLWNYVTQIDANSLGLATHVADLGYTAVEIPMTSSVLPPQLIEEVRATNLAVTCCVAMFKGRDISNFDWKIRANTEAYLTQCLESASALGATTLVGPMYAGGGKAHFLREDDRKREWDLAVIGLEKMAQRGRDLGVDLAIEPINRYRTSVVNTVAQGLQMVADIGCDNVGLHFDTYQAGIEEESVVAALEQVLQAKQLFHFHACANNRMPPPRGHFPWDEIFKTLHRYGYDRHVCIETFAYGGLDSGYVLADQTPDEMAISALAYLKTAVNGVN